MIGAVAVAAVTAIAAIPPSIIYNYMHSQRVQGIDTDRTGPKEMERENPLHTHDIHLCNRNERRKTRTKFCVATNLK